MATFNRENTINITSAFVAAQQAVLGFAELPSNAAKSFFYTGNILNVEGIPGFIVQGTGKSGAAHMMMAAAAAYKDQGYKYVIVVRLVINLEKYLTVFRFYYVDERKADGSAKYRVDGEAHGKHFWELAEAKSQGPWLQTFVKGMGYKIFDSLDRS